MFALPAPDLAFPYLGVRHTPALTIAQAPLNSVVCLILQQTCTKYSGNPEIGGVRQRTDTEEFSEFSGFGTGYILEGNPR